MAENPSGKSEMTSYQPQIYTVLPPDTTDERLVDLWLHGRPAGTQEGYRIEAYGKDSLPGQP